ncbi:RNA recognition motif protein [Ceratobasidium sp. AG-Ba]|nr:RNA recognition motif protein [Ceratobasidium sp. AG-Ba]
MGLSAGLASPGSESNNFWSSPAQFRYMPKSSTLRSADPKTSKTGQLQKIETFDTPSIDKAAPVEDKFEEVEVLSHAAQRKAKKRKLKELESRDDKVNDLASGAEKCKPKAQASDKSALPTRQNSVWVGNLSFKTTEDQLRQFFDGVGEITRVHMPKKQAVGQGRGMRGDNRGFAYVDFASPEAQLLAITFSEKNLDGRRLLIKNGGDFTGRPEASKTSNRLEEQLPESSTARGSSTAHSKTAQKILGGYIRQMIEGHGLSNDLEEQAKREGAAKNPGGKPLRWLKKIRMGTFEDSGLCKGWAFLDFLSTAYATAVLVNPRNHYLNGRKLVLEYGSPDAVRRGGGGPRPRKGETEKEQPEETPREAKRRKYAATNEQPADEGEIKQNSANKTPKGDEQYVRAKDGRLRPRPGAALAQAKREAVAIVPSSGKKIVF